MSFLAEQFKELGNYTKFRDFEVQSEQVIEEGKWHSTL